MTGAFGFEFAICIFPDVRSAPLDFLLPFIACISPPVCVSGASLPSISGVSSGAVYSFGNFALRAAFMMVGAESRIPLKHARRCLHTVFFPRGSRTFGRMSEPSGTPLIDVWPSSYPSYRCFMLYFIPDQLKSGHVQKHFTSAFFIMAIFSAVLPSAWASTKSVS